MSSLNLVLDFGGTKLTSALIECGKHEWLAYRRTFSPPGADARWDVETMLQMAHHMLGDARPAAIGISFGGPVDASTSTVRLSHHVPGWDNIALGNILEAEFDAPCQVDNDANVAALGEHRFGAGEGYDSLLYMTISTGVGGGWILNGKPWRGSDSWAGEIGHMVVVPDGPMCLCGKRGCVERFASGPFIAQDTRELLQEQPERGRIIRELVGGNIMQISGQTVSQAAEKGDELALSIIERAAWALGIGIGNAINLMNPQRIILGGGVTKAGEAFWRALRMSARETALPEIRLDIVPAALGDDSPLWGAAAMAEDCL